MPGEDFFEHLVEAVRQSWPKPKLLILNFPHNPTTEVVDLDFFEQIVEFAREHELLVVHDLAYADLVFDGYEAPSFLQVPGAKDIGVEFFTLSKSYNMPGWRVGFAVGNREMIAALARMKSYLDYGMFQPIQIAAIARAERPAGLRRRDRRALSGAARRALRGPRARRLGRSRSRKATMFVWGRIPEPYRAMGSIEFSKFLLQEAKVAVSPGHRLRRVRRRLRALRADRERAPHAPGGARHSEGARRLDASRRPSGPGPRCAPLTEAASALRAMRRCRAARDPRRADRLRHDRHRRRQAPAAPPRRDRRQARRALRLVRIADIDTTRDRGVQLPNGMLVADAARGLRGRRHRRRDRADGRLRAGAPLRAGGDRARARASSPPTRRCSRCTAARSSARRRAQRVDVGFEASVGGGIPIVRVLRDGVVADRILGVCGIVNGTCNYILSTMSAEGAAVRRRARRRRRRAGSPRPTRPSTSTASTRRTSS